MNTTIDTNSRTKTLALLTSLALAAPAWASVPITITNPGFESPVLAEGVYPTTIPNWSQGKYDVTAPTVWIPGSSGAGHYNLSTSEYTTPTAPEGDNMAYTASEVGFDTGISQVLTTTLQAEAQYDLSVKVGNPAVLNLGVTADYRIELLAGGIVLQSVAGPSPADDTTFTTATLTYSSGAAPAQLGQPLEIRLLAKDFTAAFKVDFDNVTLTRSLTSPRANPGGPYTVPIGGSLSLNGSASLPSEGQAITLYEWDLDNDGDYDEAITGVTPTAISDADLKATYGMDYGANPIVLRVTDDSPTPKTATATGTVTLAPPIGCQLGVLNLTANGGINPNTGLPWQAGDKYRLAFYTSGKFEADNTDPGFYNSLVTTQAKLNPPLAGTSWRALISTAATNIKDNTGTSNVTGGSGVGGAGEPVYVVNGSTCIARNNADIWDAWSNPFAGNAVIRLASGSTNNNSAGTPVVASQNVHYSPYIDQFGLGDSATVHGVEVWTGSQSNGTNLSGQEVGHNPNTNWGSSNANNTNRVWNRGNANSGPRSFYAISVPLTVVNLAETVKPTLISFADDRAGADLNLGTGSIVYTVAFSETIDASTLTTDDFENAGSATVTIASISGTLNPAAFNVTVTPTTAGTVLLQTKVAAVIEDPVGNAMDTTSAITDDTTITVIGDITAPMLVSIADSVSGGPIVAFNGVTYTVTFDEPINAATVNIADFGNGGSAPTIVNSVSPTGNPAVYTVSVTPTGAGDLTLQIVSGATITDLTGNPLVTTAALPDDTTITVTPDPLPTLVSIVDNQVGGPVFATQAFTYFVTFSQAINSASVDGADFENSGSPAITVNAVARTSNPSVFAIHVTSGGAGTITLQIAAGAVITNLNGTALDTTAALADDTIIPVNAGAGPARGTITVDGTVAFFANSATLSGTLNASGSDKLVVIVTGENGNPGDLSGNSTAVTYDGVALTKVVDRNPIGGNPFDQTFNDIWYLDNPSTSTGAIVASVNSRGSVTAFALSGTAPGVGQTAISPQASKSVVLSTGFANSIVIASHGMGGDGNSANVTAVNADLPLIERSAQNNGGASLWDGHVTASALAPPPGTATYAFTGGNLVGSHTIAAEFLAAEPGFDTWKATNGVIGQTLTQDHDGDGVSNGIEYFIGGPTGNTTGFTALPAVVDTAGVLSVTWTKAASYTGTYGTDFVVETSETLTGTWTTEILDPNLGFTVTITGNNVKFTFPTPLGARKFARLKVTGP